MTEADELRAMLIETIGQLVAMKRQQEVLDNLVRLVELAEALGCDVRVRAQAQGLARRIVLDLRMEAPGHELPDALRDVDELFDRDEPDQDTVEVPATHSVPKFLQNVPEETPEPAQVSESADTGQKDVKALPQPWTEDEDALAVRLKLDGVPVAEIAKRLDRPLEGTKFRLYNKLRDRIEAARDRGKAVKPQTGAPAGGHVATPAAKEKAEAEQVDPAKPETLADHIAALPRNGDWTLAQDADLMRLAQLGWNPDDLAAEMDRKAVDIQARFKVLTDKGRFPRAAVAAHLVSLVDGTAA